MPLPVLASCLKPSQPQPFFFVQNNTNIILPSGRRLYDTRKSSRSIIPVPEPSGSKPESTLKPNTAGSESNDINTIFHNTTFFLEYPLRSM